MIAQAPCSRLLLGHKQLPLMALLLASALHQDREPESLPLSNNSAESWFRMQAKAAEGRLHLVDSLFLREAKTVSRLCLLRWSLLSGSPLAACCVLRSSQLPATCESEDTFAAHLLALQQALDEHLNALLAEAPQLNPERPRRSVLLVDSGKQAPDGG